MQNVKSKKAKWPIEYLRKFDLPASCFLASLWKCVRPPIIHTYQRRGRKVTGQINNEEGKRGGDRAGGAQAQK